MCHVPLVRPFFLLEWTVCTSIFDGKFRIPIQSIWKELSSWNHFIDFFSRALVHNCVYMRACVRVWALYDMATTMFRQLWLDKNIGPLVKFRNKRNWMIFDILFLTNTNTSHYWISSSNEYLVMKWTQQFLIQMHRRIEYAFPFNLALFHIEN